MRATIVEQLIIEVISGWWKEVKEDRNVWNRDGIGVEIRKVVSESGHWRAKARGNPRKGYENGIGK